MKRSMTMPLFGELTIAEVIEAIELVSNVKVVAVSLENGIVTLEYEEIIDSEPMIYLNGLDEFEECCECGGTCNYHMDWCPYNYA